MFFAALRCASQHTPAIMLSSESAILKTLFRTNDTRSS